MISHLFLTICFSISALARAMMLIMFCQKTDEAQLQRECDEITHEVKKYTIISIIGDVFVIASFTYAVVMGALSKWWLVTAGALCVLGAVANILTLGYIKRHRPSCDEKSWLEERFYSEFSQINSKKER